MISERKPASATLSGRDHSLSGRLDIKESKENFDKYSVPRRILNNIKRKGTSVKIRQKLKYRKVNPYEKDRGEKIPYVEFNVESFSLFGLGVGQYFVQLLFYSLLFAFMGLILINTMHTYTTHYNHPATYNGPAQKWSVSCADPIQVTATENCPGGDSSCFAKYRDDCPLAKSAIVSDLVFCLLFLLGVFVLQHFEGEMEEELDEAIQSPQDYSIVVTNPPGDATDPDEWHKFFSLFGNVKYVTVTRKNKSLGDILYKKYQFISDYYGGLAAMEDVDTEGNNDVNSLRFLEQCIRKDLSAVLAQDKRENSGIMAFAGPGGSSLKSAGSVHLDLTVLKAAEILHKQGTSSKTLLQDNGFPTPGTWGYFWYNLRPSEIYREAMLRYHGGLPYYQNQLAKIDLEVCTAYRKFYPANQVFISFNSEFDKRNCLDGLEVADIKHYLPSVYGDEEMIRFRNEHVLNCVECPEADNVIYANTEFSTVYRRRMQVVASVLSASVLYGLYLFIEKFSQNWLVLTAVVGMVDVNLPFVYYYFATMESPEDHDDLHDSVLTKLFVARFLISVVFTYFVNVQWADLLTPQLIYSLLVIQVTVCVFAPLCTFADGYGWFERQILSRLLSSTREDMNNWYRGSYWLLSERYSCFAKIITVSLFYALLTPFGVFIAAFALFLTYWLDRYLLLRKWRAGPMMDATMSNRFRQLVCFSVGAHMYVTLLLLYGWPHDSAVKITDPNDSSVFHYAYADKSPPWLIYYMRKHPEWMQQSQIDTLYMYQIFTVLVILLTLYIWVGKRIADGVRLLFWTVNENVGDVQDILYEDVLATMRAYCPVIPWGNKELLFADIGNMCVEQRAFYADGGDVGLINLSELIPERKFANCMGSVRYYAEATLDLDSEQRAVTEKVTAASKRNLAKQPSKFMKFIVDLTTPAAGVVNMSASMSEKLDPAAYSLSLKKNAQVSPEYGPINEHGSESADNESSRTATGNMKSNTAVVAPAGNGDIAEFDLIKEMPSIPSEPGEIMAVRNFDSDSAHM